MKNKNITTKKQKLKNSKDNTIIAKAKNNTPIRVLYKKTGKLPEIKIIDNVYKLKKAIVQRNLKIIPYEKVYIICGKPNYNAKANIVLPFYSIYGDLLLVGIDKKEREFKGLLQEDIIWYTQDLINKSSNNVAINAKTIKRSNNYDVKEFYERDFEYGDNKRFNFEKALIDELVNIKLVLETILKSEENKNE